MAWPDDQDLPVEVWAAFGADMTADPGTWSWTDLSSRLRAEPIRLRAGKSGGAGHVSPGTCTVTLVNDDAALTPLHPMSPYWPNVELGTPLRVSLRRVEDAFGRISTSGWGTADSGQAWEGYGAGGTTAATDFPMSGGMARHSVPVAGAYRTTWLPDLKLRDCRVRLSGMSLPFSDVTGGSVEPGNILLRAQDWGSYYLARVEVTTGEAVLCKLFDPAGALLASATVPGLTHTAAQTLEVVADITGSTLSMKVWATGGVEPLGWAVTATDHSLSLPGGIGVRTGVASGNTNTKPIVASYESITVWVDRFSGYADQWEPTYLPTGVVGEMASAVRVTCSGILRRLGQGTPPVRSPIRRKAGAVGHVGLLAYWPLEDAADATQAASAVPGVAPMVARGTVAFAAGDVNLSLGGTFRFGTMPLPSLTAGGALYGTVPPGTSSPVAWSVQAFYQATDAGDDDLAQMRWETPGGSFVRWDLVQDLATVDGTYLVAYDASGAATTVWSNPVTFTGPAELVVSAVQSGGNIAVVVRFGTFAEGVSVAGTLGRITSVALNPDRRVFTAGERFIVGHLRVWDTASVVPASWWELEGDVGELAHVRLARLCAEDGVPLDVPPVADGDGTPMGTQPDGAQLDLYHDCEIVDHGVLHESGFRLGYLPRAARYNRPVDLTIDLATYCVTRGGGDPLSPVYDDQEVRNEWTVVRPGGSSATVVGGSGGYSDSVELNLATDGQIVDHAAWLVHLGTVVDLREQTFPIDLAANPELLDGWLSCRVGSRIVRTNPPVQHRPGDLDRLVEGWTETIGPRSWQVQVVPSPAQPWDVATVDGDQRVPADGSTLATALTDTGMTLSLASTAENGVWTTDPAQFPQDLRVGGERVTASGISGTGSPQTVALSARGVNGVQRSWPAGTDIDVWQPAIVPL